MRPEFQFNPQVKTSLHFQIVQIKRLCLGILSVGVFFFLFEKICINFHSTKLAFLTGAFYGQNRTCFGDKRCIYIVILKCFGVEQIHIDVDSPLPEKSKLTSSARACNLQRFTGLLNLDWFSPREGTWWFL